jgi:hypothetical protein
MNEVGMVFADADAHPSVALMALMAAPKDGGYERGLLLSRWTKSDLAQQLRNVVAEGFSVLMGNGIGSELAMTARIKAIDRISLVAGLNWERRASKRQGGSVNEQIRVHAGSLYGCDSDESGSC